MGVDVEDQLAGVGIVFQDKGREGMRIEHCLPNGLYTHTHTHTHTHTKPSIALARSICERISFFEANFSIVLLSAPH